jgi:hypothetical protein
VPRRAASLSNDLAPEEENGNVAVKWFNSIDTLDHADNREMIRRRRYGVIETARGELSRIDFRPFPKWISIVEIVYQQYRFHRRRTENRCLIYYNAPRRCPAYLVAAYILTFAGTRYDTVHRACDVLDEVARIRQSEAIVCHVTNRRMSDRVMERFGWRKQAIHPRRRHFIKRFGETGPGEESEIIPVCEAKEQTVLEGESPHVPTETIPYH